MLNLRYLSLVLLSIFVLIGCGSNGDSSVPLTTQKILSGTKTSNLLIMFPGINSSGSDFIDFGFIEPFQEKYNNVDIILVDTRLAYVEAGNISERIQNEIIVPAYAKGYDNIWLVGVSLGGFSSLLYNRDFAENVNGIVLIAPYLGDLYSVSDLIDHPSPKKWSLDNKNSTDRSIRFWRYLLTLTKPNKDNELKTDLFIAYGDKDRSSQLHQLLASQIKKENVYINEDGGHNWISWKPLWINMLDHKVFNF